MKFTPHIVGAVAMVTIGGAVSGAMIGESPVLKRGHIDSLPEAQMVMAGNDTMRSTKRPPDHYPLKTPKGTIEVAELALHGRLRDRGGDMWWEGRSDARADLDANYDFYGTASPERIAHERRLLAFTDGNAEFRQADRDAAPVAERRMTRAEAPMALAEPVEIAAAPEPAKTQRIGNAKTVDVADALAQRY